MLMANKYPENTRNVIIAQKLFFPLLRPDSSGRCHVGDGEEKDVSLSFSLYDLKMFLFCCLFPPDNLNQICVFRHTWNSNERRGEPPTLPQMVLRLL